MSEDIEQLFVSLVWFPRVSNRQLGARIFSLPDQVRTLQYKVLLVKYGQTTFRVEGVYPLGDQPPGLTDRELLDIKDLVGASLKQKFPERLIRPWDRGVIET